MVEVSAFFQGFLDEGRAKFGDDRVLVGTQEEENQVGLELPSFALQYLFHSNIMSLGKIMGLAGPQASSKSAFGFFAMRLAIEAGGVAHLIETENKLNLHFLNSIIGSKNRDRIRIDTVSTVQEAQLAVSGALAYYKKNCPEKDLPFVICVDSLAGSTTEDIQNDIRKAGFAERSFPEAALLWSNYYKALSSELINQPIILAFTNHLKDKIDSTGPAKVKTKSGGSSQDFHAAQYIYMNKIKAIDLVSREGNLIGMKAEKCGMGPANRKISVPVLWDFDEEDEDGNPIQNTVWDWHAATARLLVDKQVSGRVAKASDVTCNANKYSSQRLGKVRVSDTELGQTLFEDKEYMHDLQKAAGFRTWKVFGDGTQT